MGKIFYFMGKSASGKDTIYKEMQKCFPQLGTVVLYTTRPRRDGEENGREYFFVGKETLETLEEAGKVIECRTYHTVCGDWDYFTVDDGQINLEKESCLMMGTLVSYRKMRDYFGAEQVIPFYIEVEDGERLFRAVQRERGQKEPRYAEVCRRFLADSRDFSEENLTESGIRERYENQNLAECLDKISEKIQSFFPRP